MKKQAFTLIEMVVVIGVLGIIMAVVTGILINSFRAKTRIDSEDLVSQIGAGVIGEIKNNMITAVGTGVTCSSGSFAIGSTISFVNGNDGVITNLVCYEGTKIASESANGNFDLTASGVTVTGCHDFARCNHYPGSTDKISSVDFSFTLSTGNSAAGAEKFVERKFQSTVVVRN